MLPAERVKGEMIEALRQVQGVRQVVTFGSLASNTADKWSDVDVLIGCDDVFRTEWIAAAAIRAAKSVLFYRKFSWADQPSGRYWFADESPFTRLDVSFQPMAMLATEVAAGTHAGYPMASRSEYEAPATGLEPATERAAGPNPLHISAAETELGRLLYVYLEAVKAHRRGRPGTYDVGETRRELTGARTAPSLRPAAT